MVRNLGPEVGASGVQPRLSGWAEALSAALADAQTLLAKGETHEAELRAKAVSALARAAREVSELTAAHKDLPEENVEAVRAELRRRVAGFIVQDQAGATLEELERIATHGDEP